MIELLAPVITTTVVVSTVWLFAAIITNQRWYRRGYRQASWDWTFHGQFDSTLTPYNGKARP